MYVADQKADPLLVTSDAFFVHFKQKKVLCFACMKCGRGTVSARNDQLVDLLHALVAIDGTR